MMKTHALIVVLVAALGVGAAAVPSKADFLVDKARLQEVEPAFGTVVGDMYAGLLPIDRQEGKLMFWLYESVHAKDDNNILIWFNGGPGCSSFHAGMFFEMGPVTTPLRPAGSYGQQAHERYGPNPYSWVNASNVMYVEQPVGTGFSFGADPPIDEEGVSADFYAFLQHFYQAFPDYRDKNLFLVAESYAGYYVPSMAHFIYRQNLKEQKPHINLAGIALGNGWADVETQGPVVIDYAYWHGMIDSVTRDAFHEEWEHCRMRTGAEPEPFHPMTTPDECGVSEAVLKAAGAGLFANASPNQYDVTTWDKYLLVLDPHNSNEQLLNNPKVQEALHVPNDIGKRWMGCIPGAGRRRGRRLLEEQLPGKVLLMDDKPYSMAPYLVDLLDGANIEVLIYNGDRDLSTCVQGSEMILDALEWSGAKDWKSPHKYRRALWMVDDQVAGYAKSLQNLHFVVVLNSGHLVPYNQPKVALDLVTRFVHKKPFGDVDIPVVFDPSIEFRKSLSKAKGATTATGTRVSSALPPALLGFLVGVAATFAYFKRKNGKPQYEQVGDVET